MDCAALTLLTLHHDLRTFPYLLYIASACRLACPLQQFGILLYQDGNGHSITCTGFGGTACYNIHILLFRKRRYSHDGHFAPLFQQLCDLFRWVLLVTGRIATLLRSLLSGGSLLP